MKTLRILIVEDEPLIAMDLKIMVIVVTATVVVEASVAATKEVLHEALDFAFLDVDVTNGKTFEIAQILERKRVPFVFISGSPQEQLPSDLRSAPFIPKPFYPAQIERCRLSQTNPSLAWLILISLANLDLPGSSFNRSLLRLWHSG